MLPLKWKSREKHAANKRADIEVYKQTDVATRRIASLDTKYPTEQKAL